MRSSLADCLNRILRLKEWLGLFKEGHDPTPVSVDEVSLRRKKVSQIHAMTDNMHESQSSGHVFWVGVSYSLRDAGVYQVGSAEHRNAAYQLALESMTLLKNEGNVLPLHAPTLGSSGARVVITGEGSLRLCGYFHGRRAH